MGENPDSQPASSQQVSWLSMLRTARAPLAVIVLAGLGLVVPSQAHDMLAALGDGTFFPGPVLWFYVALAALTFSGWYWARALISARFDVPQTDEGRTALQDTDRRLDLLAFDTVPWLIFLLSGLVGLGLIWRGGAWHAAWFLLAWVVVAAVFRPGRKRDGVRQPRRIARANQKPYRALGGGEPRRSTNKLRDWWAALPAHLRLLTHRAPGGAWAAWCFLLLALAVFVWSAIASFAPSDAAGVNLPLLLADRFPGSAAALICLALLIAPLSAITFLADGFRIEFKIGDRTTGPSRPPVIVALALLTGLTPFLFHLHTVRTVEGALQKREDLGKYFIDWVEACAPGGGPVQPVIVALSGGASRSAVWGAQVLQDVERLSIPGGPTVFAVSSVSGGSLGAAAYMALLAGLPDAERCAAASRHARQHQIDQLAAAPLGKDVLAALLSGWLAGDIPRALLTPFAAVLRIVTGGDQPRGGDRAEILERGFERLWAASWTSTQRQAFDKPFLSLFYDDQGPRKGMPLWIANGTDLNGGSRLLTLPVTSRSPQSDWPFATARDVLTLLNADVPISTAINNSARFPFLEPSGELLRAKSRTEAEAASWIARLCDQVRFCALGPTEIIDGGYFENEGLQTTLELADWLQTEGAARLEEATKQTREVRPIIIQATADGSTKTTTRDVIRRNSPPDNPGEAPPAPATFQLFVPLSGLEKTRGGHSAILLRAAQDQYPCDFFHFMLPAMDGEDVPLNWVLSEKTTKSIREATAKAELGNADELGRLRERLQAAPAGRDRTACR